MSGCVSMNLGLSSPLKMEGEGTIVNKKHGIVSILGSDSDNRSSRASSLRRTLSADMSSKKWLSQNGLSSPPKKNASQESRGGGGGGGEDSEVKSAFDIWTSIQEEKKKEIEGERNGQVDVWGLILSEKKKDVCMGKSVPPPYVHPLVRRSKSSLSERSLEICTESLGSETGSEGFSWYNLSEKSEEVLEEKDDVGNFQGLQKEPEKQEFRAWKQEEPVMAAKSSCLGDKKSTQRSFPPPIQSLSRQDGASTYMRTRRDNGRLVLEAVEIPSKDNFCAQRQDGRLVLTFAKANQNVDKTEEITDEMEQEKEENGFESSEEEEGEGHDEMEMRFAMEQAPKFSTTHGLISVHRLALMVNKRIRANLWSSKNLNDIIKPKGSEKEEEEEEEEKPAELEKPKPKSQSLPPRPRPRPPAATTTTSLNVYEYYWRPKPIRMGSTDEKSEEQQYVVVRRNKQQGNGDEVLVVNGCKDQKRSLLFWEPYCIPTS
ncbi:PREDICTED: protein FAF-like, chloroplastic [Tarenaya hassleriana]|uniref:protein FAF-like, chloroplastic n=1 Tax=Tarenaya hassleriana TaxID=28532 RepID=UPI00053C5C65|nr:PREDICTED: protein FAF-like, chloroplastic [Tarenaya hassleriana]